MLIRTASKSCRCWPSPAARLVLTGCVTVPDAIKGTSPSPVTQLSSVQNAPNLFTGAEARFGGTVVNVANEQGRTVLRLRRCRSTAVHGRYWANRRAAACWPR